MATFFERMIGVGDEPKIATHDIISSFYELHRGELTGDEIAAKLLLSEAQKSAMQTIWQAITDSADSEKRINEFFDLITLGELAIKYDRGGDYTNESIFSARINGFT